MDSYRGLRTESCRLPQPHSWGLQDPSARWIHHKWTTFRRAKGFYGKTEWLHCGTLRWLRLLLSPLQRWGLTLHFEYNGSGNYKNKQSADGLSKFFFDFFSSNLHIFVCGQVSQNKVIFSTLSIKECSYFFNLIISSKKATQLFAG